MASANYGSPTLPTGYTYWAYVSPIRIGSTNNQQVGYILYGNTAKYGYQTASLLNGSIPAGNTPAQDLANTSLYLPPQDCYVEVGGAFTGITSSGGATTADLFLYSDASAGAQTWFPLRLGYPVAGVSLIIPVNGRLRRIAGTNLRWSVNFAEGTGYINLTVLSFAFSNGAH